MGERSLVTHGATTYPPPMRTTLAAASAILDWMRCEGLTTATDDQMAIIVPKILAASCEPAALEMAKSLAAKAAQDAASITEESATATKLILP